MTDIQVRARTSLSSLIALPDSDAARALNDRMGVLKQIEELYEVSYSERVIIIREFEVRRLWKHLIDDEVGEPFANLTAWLSSGFLGCRRVNMEAHRDIKLLGDVPSEKLIDVPKGNLKVLAHLSTAVRNQEDVLEAAKTLPRAEFEEKVEREQPEQHIEVRAPMSLRPGRSERKVIERWITYAVAHDLASSPTEAIVRACERCLIDEELNELRPLSEEVTA